MAISTIGTDALAASAVTSTKLASGVPSRSQLPAGTVLQVVSANYSTQVSTSSATYTDTGLTATITPTSATSKIFVLISHSECIKGNTGTATRIRINLNRNGSAIAQFAEDGLWNNTAQYQIGAIGFNYLDSPATTSAVTYKTQFASSGAAGSVTVQYNSMTSTITLMEIAA